MDYGLIAVIFEYLKAHFSMKYLRYEQIYFSPPADIFAIQGMVTGKTKNRFN
jgi:hypothetical protein